MNYWTLGMCDFYYYYYFKFSITHKRKCNRPKAAVIQNNKIHIHIESTTQSSGKVQFLNCVLPKLHEKVQFLTSSFSNTSIVVTTSIK